MESVTWGGKMGSIRRLLICWLRAAWNRRPVDIIRRHPRPCWPGESDRFSYQSQITSFDIKQGVVVLDIGSGHYPFPNATVLADLYLGESPHRSELLIRDNRPLFLCDVHNLPFRDRSIDFVYCSHVLEHVQNPFKACLEIIRVGKRGYIECPTFGKDTLFGWAADTGHKWHVTAIANTLVFFEYTERQRKGICSKAWRDIISAPYYHPLQEAFYKNQDVFNTMLMWRDSFRIFAFRLNGTVETNDERKIPHLQH